MWIFWFILWLIFAASILVVLGWSTNVLLVQRKAWIEFAAKYKLDVQRGARFLAPVTLSGAINGRRLNIYVQSEQTEAERTQRVYSHIEVYLNGVPPSRLVFSRKPLVAALADVVLAETTTIQSPDWPVMAVAMCDDAFALANWFTVPRTRALKTFMDSTTRASEAVVVCDGNQAFLLWRTEDPLRDPRELNAVVQRLFGYAKELDSVDMGNIAKPNPSSATPSPDASA